ncbi:MAG: signal peptide peptidase SppA [Actinomycetota bacterium]
MARSGTKRFFVVLGIVVVLGAVWLSAFAVGGFAGSLASSDAFEEVLLEEGDSSDKIAMINVVGEIFSDPEGSYDGATDANILAQLQAAQDDPAVEGIILNVDTPGGTVLASDVIYRKVQELNKDKPVVALMGDVAASGGYYISMGASEIVAHPYTTTGSIGVIMMLPNLQEAAGKLGIRTTVLKSGEFKDAGSPLRELTDQEKAVFQSLVDEAYNGFVRVVAEGRDMPVARVRELADGRIYSGNQAKELDLIDQLGDRDLAFERAKDLAGASDASLVVYRTIGGLFDNLLPFGDAPDIARQVGESLGIRRGPGVAYLWLT